MLKNFKKILKIVIDMLTLFVFLILLLIIVSKVKMIFSGKNYFDFFGYSVFNVATGSMEPTLKQNDIILVKKCDDYVVDDIVTFESDVQLIKVPGSIVLIFGNVISFSEIQLSKALKSISVMLSGMFIFLSDSHSLNISEGIFVILSGNVTDCRDLQF